MKRIVGKNRSLITAIVIGIVYGCTGAAPTPNPTASPVPPASPAPTPIPSGEPSASAAPSTTEPSSSVLASPSLDPNDTSAWLPFVSERYGFSMAYPPDWSAHLANGDWTFPEDTAWPDGLERTDWFYLDGADGSVAASAWSAALEPDVSADQWFLDYCAVEVTPCYGTEPKIPASLDGHAGWFVPSSDPQAYFGIGDRIYLVVIWQPEDHPALEPYGGGRQLVEAFLSTMRLPAAPSPTATIQDIMELEKFAPLETGSYFIDPDSDPSTPLRVVYEVDAEGWSQWFGALKDRVHAFVMINITTVVNLVRHGCDDHSWADPPVGPSVDDLAGALADLAPFRLTSPPEDVTIYGYRGQYLELTVPDLEVAGDDFTECVDGNLLSWVAPIDVAEGEGGAFHAYNAEPGRIEEFWILDVDGTRLVIEANWSPASPQEDVNEMRAILDSIRIEP